MGVGACDGELTGDPVVLGLVEDSVLEVEGLDRGVDAFGDGAEGKLREVELIAALGELSGRAGMARISGRSSDWSMLSPLGLPSHAHRQQQAPRWRSHWRSPALLVFLVLKQQGFTVVRWNPLCFQAVAHASRGSLLCKMWSVHQRCRQKHGPLLCERWSMCL